jgi:hypothetical protein
MFLLQISTSSWQNNAATEDSPEEGRRERNERKGGARSGRDGEIMFFLFIKCNNIVI